MTTPAAWQAALTASVVAGSGVGRPGLDELDGEHRAAAPDVADHRGALARARRAGRSIDARRSGGRAPTRSSLLDRRDRAERGGARDRVAAVGAAEPAGVHRVHDLGATGDAGERQPAGDALRRGDEVGHHALVLAGEQVAGPGEPGLDLVGDEQHAVRRAPRRRAPAGIPAPARRTRPRPGSARSTTRPRWLRPTCFSMHGDRRGRGRLAADRAPLPERVGHRRPVDLTARTGRSRPCTACSSRSSPS